MRGEAARATARIHITLHFRWLTPVSGGMWVEVWMPKLPSGQFLTSREACDRAGFSRPDAFLRSWRAARLPVYARPSGRKVVAASDFAKFIGPEARGG